MTIDHIPTLITWGFKGIFESVSSIGSCLDLDRLLNSNSNFCLINCMYMYMGALFKGLFFTIIMVQSFSKSVKNWLRYDQLKFWCVKRSHYSLMKLKKWVDIKIDIHFWKALLRGIFATKEFYRNYCFKTTTFNQSMLRTGQPFVPVRNTDNIWSVIQYRENISEMLIYFLQTYINV